MFYCRIAKKEDVGLVVNIMHDTGYTQFYPNKSDSEIKKDLLKSKDVLIVCVEKKLFNPEHIVGYFIFGSVKKHLVPERKFLDIDDTYAYHCGVGVIKTFKRRGLGKKLTKFAFKLAKKSFNGMYASVGSNNLASLNLQEKIGFVKIAEYKCSYRKGCNNVLFVKIF